MTKRLIVALALALALCTCVLCACNTHTHTFEQGYSGKNETHHWHKATCEHADEISGKAPHVFENHECTVCGYTQSQEPPKTVIVTLNYDGATDGNTQKTVSLTVGKKVGTLPTPTKDDYYFLGWQLDGITVTSETIWQKCENNLVLVAKWGIPTNGLAYELISDKQSYAVVGMGTSTDKDIVIPSIYNNKPVVHIQNLAFQNKSITSVFVSNNITSIGEGAFSDCKSLTSITIPDSVTSIGASAFANCSSLTSVTVPNSVTSIEEDAFYGCNTLESITLPFVGSKANATELNYDTVFGFIFGYKTLTYSDGVNDATYQYKGNGHSYYYYIPSRLKNVTITGRKIMDSAFYNCSNLTSITIADSVKSIGVSAFYGCKSLEKVNYLGDMISWCGISFASNDANPLSNASNLYLNDKMVTELIIPDNVTSIRDNAFSGCGSITSITIPNSVTSIGDRAFDGCHRLVEVFNKSSLNITAGSKDNGYVGYSAKNVYTPMNGASKLVTDNNGFVVYNGDILIDYVGTATEIVIPSSISTINQFALYVRNNLINVTIPNSVTSIGKGMFMGCSSLTSVTIDSSATSIDDWVFGYCNSLTSVTISNEVTRIGENAFYECESLTSVTIPDSVVSIGRFAFNGCSSLENIAIPDSVTSIGEGAFSDCKSLTSITIPDSVKSIGDYAFLRCSSLTSVIIGNSVTSIGDAAFYECSRLTNITIPDSVTSIGAIAFVYCSSLTSVTIGKGVTSIGDEAFLYCSNLETVQWDATACTNAGSYSHPIFTSCSKLTNVVIGENVTSFPIATFYKCSSLNKVNHLGDVSSWFGIIFGSYDANPLYYAHNLYLNDELVTDLVIPDSVTSIGEYAFYGCSSLKSITIPNSVTSIDSHAFFGCDELTKITIPDSITSIGVSTFEGCSSLQYNEYNNGLYLGNKTNPYVVLVKAKDTNIITCSVNKNTKVVNREAFRGCRSLTSIIMPDSVISIGDAAFDGCSSLTSVIIGNSVTSIGDAAFSYCSNLNTVYYKGTVEDWAKINIGSDNNYLTSATRYYYSETEPKLNAEGTAYDDNYWHYVDGKPVVWVKEQQTA